MVSGSKPYLKVKNRSNRERDSIDLNSVYLEVKHYFSER